MSRVIEAPPITDSQPSARVVDGLSPQTLTAKTGTLTPVAQRIDDRASPLPTAMLPVARSVEPGKGIEQPVARIAEAAPAVVNGARSTMDILRTAQRAASGETVEHGTGLVLTLPSVVPSRQAEPAVVQREQEVSPPEPVAPPVPAAAGPAAVGPSAVGPSAAPAAQPETEELVKKLFDPLLRRLKTELRLDRERRGALTDRPH